MGSASFYFNQPSFCIALAVHAGSRVRPDLLKAMEAKENDRYREEDPGTDRIIQHFPIQIIARDSRFEYDINRERHRAIYATIKESWGIKVWKRNLSPQEIEISLAKHDEFHKLLDIVIHYVLEQNQFGVVFDCHSYNFQREERLPWYEDKKPDINIGTAAVNQSVFGDIIDDFIQQLSKINVDGHSISVAENEIFQGGYISRKLCAEHNNRLLVLAIEFKKIFMNEWSGEICNDTLQELEKQFWGAAKETMSRWRNFQVPYP